MRNAAYCLLTLFLTAVSLSAGAQARQDDLVISLDTISAPLSSATGWTKSATTGKWVSHPNFIGEETAVENYSVSFRWLKTAKFHHDGATYFVWYYLRRENLKSAVAFVYHYAVMDASRYQKLMSVLATGGKVTVPVVKHSYIPPPADEAGLTQDISLHILKELGKPKFTIDSISVDRQTIDGKDIVRFDPTYTYRDGSGYFEVSLRDFMMAQLPVTSEQADVSDPDHRAAADLQGRISQKLTGWQTSDTLFSRDCTLNSQVPTPYFNWAAVSSFVADGRKQYCLYFEAMRGRKKEINYLLIDEISFATLRQTINKKAGRYDLSSIYFSHVQPSQPDLQYAIAYLDKARFQSSKGSCFITSAGKNTVKFMLPGYDCNTDTALKDTSFPPTYECPVAIFSRLLSLP